MSASTTHVVVLTPPGRGAVATVLVAGPRALDLVNSLVFRSPSTSPLEPGPRIRLARWQTAEGEEVVIAPLAGDRVEIHCHGGIAASQNICQGLVAGGGQMIDWQAFGAIDQPDPIRRAAAAALAKATTQRAATILLDQYQGAFGSALAEIRDRVAAADWPSARQMVGDLLARWPVGSHLAEPWRVVLAGPPNVGKSSLINALVGYERAIVFDSPGTTRDRVTAITALEGWPVELCDTAGLRASGDPLEAAGIQLAADAAAGANCLLLIFDSQQPWQADCAQLSQRWPEAIVVYSKSDLGPPPVDDRPPGIATSAVTRAGLDQLERAIARKLVPLEPARGLAIPFTREQFAMLERVLAAIAARSADTALALLPAAVD